MSDVQGKEKGDVSAQAERVNLTSLCHFVLFEPSTDWRIPFALVRVMIFPQSADLNAISSQTLSQPHQEIMLCQLWRHSKPGQSDT